MTNAHLITTACVCILAGSPGLADLPPLGGPMNHVLVNLNASNEIVLGVEDSSEMVLVEAPQEYTGPAAVLNGTRFNAQYGWLVNGLWAPPPGGFVYAEVVDQSPGLATYAGRAFGPYSFMDPLFETAGSSPRMVWDGVMLHNYHAASTPGHYAATYRVYVGDAAGEPMAGYTPGEISLGWVWEPDCAADIAEPFGVLDLSDITAFVSAFVLQTPPADVAEPFGMFDLTDITTFVEIFMGGCP